jgi:RNA 2',3'-cyclic 3'-phosphodiesterase
MSQKFLRLFFGMSLPEQLREELSVTLDQLTGDNRIKKTKLSNLHTTLLFLGRVEASAIPELVIAAAEVFNGFAGFTLIPKDLILMPSEHKPKMFWLLYNSNEQFSILNQHLKSRIRRFYEYEDIENPIPHTTLARLKAGVVPSLPAQTNFSPLPVNTIHLYTSETFPEGPEYSVIETFELKTKI